MTRRMRTMKALRLIRQHKPVTPKHWAALGLKFEFLGRGVFREVCRIKGTDLVVKSPLGTGTIDPKLGTKFDYREGIAHSKSEMARLNRLARVAVLRPYLPQVYYYDAKYGQIVMRYYPV